jgi:hypothetical protein
MKNFWLLLTIIFCVFSTYVFAQVVPQGFLKIHDIADLKSISIPYSWANHETKNFVDDPDAKKIGTTDIFSEGNFDQFQNSFAFAGISITSSKELDYTQFYNKHDYYNICDVVSDLRIQNTKEVVGKYYSGCKFNSSVIVTTHSGGGSKFGIVIQSHGPNAKQTIFDVYRNIVKY